jgi:3-oxoacyl-[acyl-carrier protein] reductase
VTPSSNVRFDFSGRSAIVTGASGGIGAEVVRLLHASGAHLVLVDLQPEALETLADELGRERVTLVPGDASAQDTIDAAVAEAVAASGSVDLLLPVAGIYPRSTVAETSDELWERVQRINLNGVFKLIRACIPHFGAGSAVVTFASVAGHRGSQLHAHYAASKAGVIALTRSLAHELGPAGVRVNAVSPGTINTGMVKDLVSDRGESMMAQTPLHRFGEPGEVAAAAVFLASDAASFITGETLHVNGGLFMAG